MKAMSTYLKDVIITLAKIKTEKVLLSESNTKQLAATR